MPELFDHLSRIAGSDLPRREALRLIAGGLAGGCWAVLGFPRLAAAFNCPSGSICGSRDQCLQTTGCCAVSQVACPGTDRCCDKVAQCLPHGSGCCASEQVACPEGGCCNSVAGCLPQGGCCGGTQVVCPGGEGCCDSVAQCLPHGSGCCGGGQVACPEGGCCNSVAQCLPHGSGCCGGRQVACPEGGCCDSLKQCKPAGRGCYTLPMAAVTGAQAGPPATLEITVRGVAFGITHISVLSAVNAAVPIPPFLPGDLGPIVVTATKIDQARPSSVELDVCTTEGGCFAFDPVVATVRIPSGRRWARESFPSIAPAERFVTLENGSRGVRRAELFVNGRMRADLPLAPGEVRTIDLGEALDQPSNLVALVVEGRPGANVLVLVADDGGASATPRRVPWKPGDVRPEQDLRWLS